MKEIKSIGYSKLMEKVEELKSMNHTQPKESSLWLNRKDDYLKFYKFLTTNFSLKDDPISGE
ncbi:MAG: hypothetical protein EA362_00170 [Saprospirales bacterium]|jgi:hypothetical protein|nr:MAG: hypothetical protein EA362_00170 [Saprospirales bacterium]